MQTTTDKLLGGRFAVEQPAEGYRIAVDTLLLAAAVPAQEGQRILELGCGVGGAMLALAVRVEGADITGIELQKPMVSLCESNIRLNGFEGRMRALDGDVTALDDAHKAAYDHVMINPPYHDGKRHGASENHSKKLANTENDEANLGVWIAAAVHVLHENGTMTMIHRSDRQDEITAICLDFFDSLRIKPLWSHADGRCKRIIIRAEKCSEKCNETRGVVMEPPLILYGQDGRYSAAAEAILRHAQAME